MGILPVSEYQVICALLSLFNTATKRKRPQKPAVQVDDTEIKGMQPPHPSLILLSYYIHTS